jgi:hypothetical protein
MNAPHVHLPVIERLDSRRLLSSIAGLWTGSRTENGLSGTFANVTINLNLRQSGTFVKGTETRTTPRDPAYFADILTHGTLVGNIFTLQDDSITASQRPSNYKWLLYKATLTLSPDGQTLSGRWHASGVKGNMTLRRVRLPLFLLNKANTLDNNSVIVHYAISKVDITDPLRFDVYRSSTDRLDASSQLIGSETLSPTSHPARLNIGLHRATLLAGTRLIANKKRPFIIIVADADRAVIEARGSINVTVLKLK